MNKKEKEAFKELLQSLEKSNKITRGAFRGWKESINFARTNNNTWFVTSLLMLTVYTILLINL